MNKVAWIYILFIVVISALWFINYNNLKIIGMQLSGVIAFILFIVGLFIRFIEHKTVMKCLKFTFSNNQRQVIIEDLRTLYENEFKEKNSEPVKKK